MLGASLTSQVFLSASCSARSVVMLNFSNTNKLTAEEIERSYAVNLLKFSG